MPHTTLAENVAAALRHAILHGAYACGERLVELTIAQEMNVSQNTVRDALRLLEQDGLVVKRARYGTHVRDYTPEEAAEIYALWAAVEGLALQWLIPHLIADQIAHLRDLLAQFRERPTAEGRMQIHAALASWTPRPHTAQILRHLHNQARLIDNARPAEDWAAQVDRYEALIDALAAGDLPRAQAMLQALFSA